MFSLNIGFCWCVSVFISQQRRLFYWFTGFISLQIYWCNDRDSLITSITWMKRFEAKNEVGQMTGEEESFSRFSSNDFMHFLTWSPNGPVRKLTFVAKLFWKFDDLEDGWWWWGLQHTVQCLRRKFQIL